MRVALVACCGPKLPTAAKARDLYRSRIFAAAASVAQYGGFDAWAILSAKYGLVMPDTIIQPYDLALKDQDAAYRRRWAERCERRLQAQWPRATFVVLAGAAYAAATRNLRAEYPMAGIVGFGAYQRRLAQLLQERT